VKFTNNPSLFPIYSHAKLERILNRPVFSHDRILFASSLDGLNWSDLNVPALSLQKVRGSMTYFAGVDIQTNTFYALSSGWIKKSKSWRQFLFCDGEWRSCFSLEIPEIHSFSICNNVMYTIEKFNSLTVSRIRAYSLENSKWPEEEITQFWPAVTRDLQDLSILCSRDNYLAVGTLNKGLNQSALLLFTSVNGQTWELSHEVFLEGVSGVKILSNPSLCSLDNDEIRLFFRSGTKPAVGNSIYSAVSSDLYSWNIEPGKRIGPHGKWANHGVGFPSVWKNKDHYLMAYGAYWGENKYGETVKDHWTL
jgi:hypothetical protein